MMVPEIRNINRNQEDAADGDELEKKSFDALNEIDSGQENASSESDKFSLTAGAFGDLQKLFSSTVPNQNPLLIGKT